jgi:hypothetical protein
MEPNVENEKTMMDLLLEIYVDLQKLRVDINDINKSLGNKIIQLNKYEIF